MGGPGRQTRQNTTAGTKRAERGADNGRRTYQHKRTKHENMVPMIGCSDQPQRVDTWCVFFKAICSRCRPPDFTRASGRLAVCATSPGTPTSTCWRWRGTAKTLPSCSTAARREPTSKTRQACRSDVTTPPVDNSSAPRTLPNQAVLSKRETASAACRPSASLKSPEMLVVG